MAKILIVEDDLDFCAGIVDCLTGEGHTVDSANEGKEGYDRLRFYHYDIVILDWQMPGMTGPEICAAYRKNDGRAPVLMLTGKDQIKDKTTGLDAGADDYLIKPCDPDELRARVRALLRRPAQYQETVITFGPLTVDPTKHKTWLAEKEISLSPREFALLEFFMRNPDQVFSAEALLNRVWSSDSDVSPDVIRVFITRLRTKLEIEGKPSMIQTVHRLGYQLKLVD